MRKKIICFLILGFAFLALFPCTYAQSYEDSDGDGISDTLEIERSTDPFSSEKGLGAITGFMSKQSPSNISKEAIIFTILVGTVALEIGIYWFWRKNRE